MIDETNRAKLAVLSEDLIRCIGDDPSRPGLLKTPERFSRALLDLTTGYSQSVDEIVNGAIFYEDYSEMVIVKNIEFYSLCEHHLLPFFGHAHVAYLPNGKILGLSKIPRIVNMFARRLQVQERMVDQITSTLENLLQPHGIACMIEASHMCMMMRGIQLQSSQMITNSLKGDFLNNPPTREEFFMLVSSSGRG